MAEEILSEKLYRAVRKVVEASVRFVSVAANAALVKRNWEIGRLIVEDEQGGKRKADYGKAVLAGLANRLTIEFGNGYTLTNLKYMRQFYLAFPIGHALRDELNWTHYRILMRVVYLAFLNRHTLCDKLNWSHYRLLASVENEKARQYYHDEAAASGWNARRSKRRCCSATMSPIRRASVSRGKSATAARQEFRRRWHERYR